MPSASTQDSRPEGGITKSFLRKKQLCCFLQSQLGQPYPTVYKRKKPPLATFFFYGLPGRIRTCDLESRSLTRYPAVPRADMRSVDTANAAFSGTSPAISDACLIISLYIIPHLHRFVKYFCAIPLDKFFYPCYNI